MTKKVSKISPEDQALLDIAKLERSLATTCNKLYTLETYGRRLHPVHPFILVRVLPKEHKTEGGIFLADTSQNKPVYEGIVLETWRPYDEVRHVYRPVCEGGYDTNQEITIHHECDVKVGDRVFFPHYEGVSMLGYLDEKHYRMIREYADQNKNPYMQVLGKVDYQGDKKLAEEIRRLSAKFYSISMSGIPSASRGANPHEVAR